MHLKNVKLIYDGKGWKMKIKKNVSFALVMLMILTACTSLVFASNDADNYGSTVGFDGIRIIINDADGNIVEVHDLHRNVYVNGTQYTIPAGGDLTTYQYYSSIEFYAGFFFEHSAYSGYATTRNRSVTIKIRNASSVGGTRYLVKSGTFSTNEEDNVNSLFYDHALAEGNAIVYSATASSARPYYDAVYHNNSSSPLTISLLVGRD